MGFDVETRIGNVTAVLGPTNTGKTHLAIEQMLQHETGMIGLPLRLLAREVYDKIVARVGVDKVALITGEEKIRPESPRYWVSTVEAMPREIDVDFLAIDEIQLAADPERGHVFTDRLLNARGRRETLMLGAQTMRDAIADLVPRANFITRPRLSKLSYTGQKKITRLPARSAVVAFSASEVYSIAELIRRQQGGAAVVLGALSPRTRNAQVALYQSGDVDFLVATDAIGMGLNLDVDHVAFSATRKFDGQQHRQLTPAELAQIAGRAGRYLNDGTFGVTGNIEPFDQDVIERLESHTFDAIKMLQWRARKLDFSSLAALHESLRQLPNEPRLQRARSADDLEALDAISADREVTAMATGGAAVATLWDVCQIPDYRKISNQNHAELAGAVYKFLMRGEQVIPEDWFAKQVEFADRTDGDIDTLANRIAHIRTWTFVSNRTAWLKDPAHWQGRTRAIEDALSDALHEQLTQRFVDRRTSALMKGLRAKEELSADIGEDGAILVESHYVGRLKGFRFIPDTQGEGIHGKATRNAAAQVLEKELAMRVRRVVAARNDAFKATRNGRIVWRDQDIAKLEPAEDILRPQIQLICDEHLQAADKDKVLERLNTWLSEMVADKLKPLADLSKAEDISGLAKGIAFRLLENLGSLKREAISDEIRSLDQEARSQLRKYGVRFGAFNIYFPQLLKPAAAELTALLWTLKHAATSGLDLENLPEPPRPGLTSTVVNAETPEAYYRARGYHLCGPRAVRMDILERLADLIRPLVGWRRHEGSDAAPPRGSSGDGGFLVIPEMLSILGCSSDELGALLNTLGFRLDRRVKKPPAPALAGAATDASATTETGTEAAAEAASPDAPAQATAPEPVASEAAVPSSVEAGPVASDPAPDASVATSEPAAIPDAQPSDTAQAASAEATAGAPAPQTADDAAAAKQEAAASSEAVAAGRVTAEDNASTGRDETGAGVAVTDVGPAGESNAAEPEMEDVWRPKRRREHGRGDERQRNRNRQRRGGDRQTAAPQSQGSGEQATDVAAAGPSGEQRNRQNRRPDRKRLNQQNAGQNAATGEGKGQAGSTRDGAGRQGANQAGGSKGAGYSGDRGGEGWRSGQRRDQRGQEQRGKGQSQSGGKQHGGKQRQTADPDSPFAKLIALKLELEKRAQEQSSS